MRALIIGLMLFALPAHAADCGAADAPCEVESGTYHILLPEGGATPVSYTHLTLPTILLV